MTNRDRTTTVLRTFLHDVDGVAQDLTAVGQWLNQHADALTDADVFGIRIAVHQYSRPTGVVVDVQCRDARSLGVVTRLLIRGAGTGVVTKELQDMSDGSTHAHVIRQFGNVAVDAWAPYECTTERRTVPGGYETRTVCPPLLALAAA